MNNPSEGIARELIPHIHLVSTYRFPLVPVVHPEKAAEYLVSAPKIARDTAPFYWTYLDCPQSGTVLLVWQSTSIGTDFPSDGYVWAQPELAYQIPVNSGFTLEMHHQKVGYRPGEQLATHSRRRYRLHSPNNSTDLNLWLVHYGPADPNDRVPSAAIPVDQRMQTIMNTRGYLQSHGQIVQKDFMLHDRSNWPQIQFPRNQPRNPQIYAGGSHQARIPQSMAYPTQQQPIGPPAKRLRTQGNVSNAAAAGAAVHDIDDDEDTSRGDLFDHTTPREVSISRYKQNHEWMEEILSSPYALHQITPADLGLGLRGDLAGLTDGIFEAPYDPDKDVVKHEYVGRLDLEQAVEFRQKAAERIEDTKKQIENMKAKHAKRMARFQKGSILSRAEKDLRTAVANPSDQGPEYWRLEGRIDDEAEEGKRPITLPSKVDDILAHVEASLGLHAAAAQELRRIQDGGFEEIVVARSPSPVVNVPSPQKSASQSHNGNGTPQSGVMITDADMDMGNSAAGLLDQYPASRTPGSMFSTPQAHLQTLSSNGTPGMHASSPQPDTAAPQAPAQGDVNLNSSDEQTAPAESGDWVVVPQGGVSPGPDSTAPAQQTTTDNATTSAPLTPTPASQPPTTTDNTPLPDFSTSPNDFADLGDLDTAGDAMASYGESGDMELDMDVGMDDSAFGDAFHGVEHQEDGIDEHGDGM